MSSAERSPLFSLILLIILALAGSLLFTIFGMIIGGTIYGIVELSDSLSTPLSWNRNEAGMALVRILLLFSSVGTFVASALIFAKLESRSWLKYLKISSAPYTLFIITILITLASLPVMEWVSLLNQKIHLPEAFKNLEQWLSYKENTANEFTKKLLIMHRMETFWINLLIIAIIPAIGEELFFRGCLQSILQRWIGNQHAAIWVTAVIFSAIHLQFFGFIPKMLLGALFGYLLVWSNSLWVPILAHFINNATVVIISYVSQQQGVDLEQQPVSNLFFSAASLLVTIIFLYFFYKKSLDRKNRLLQYGATLD